MKTLLFIFSMLGPAALLAQQDGDSLWNRPGMIHDIYLNFPQSSYWDTLTANYTADVDTRCDLTIDGTLLPNIGAKFKGNSSYNGPSVKKSFKLDLNEFVPGQDFDGIKKFNLNNSFKDPSFMREKLMLDFLRTHGFAAPRCTYARLYINNTYWGLYTLVEEVNSKFLNQHYNHDNGNLFKGDPTGDLRWYGSTPSQYYTRYELENNETVNDWSDLVHLIDVINNTPSVNFYDSLETVLNTAAALGQLAVCNMFSSLDSYPGSGHNYYIYHDTISGRFEWIAWDLNEAFGNFKMNLSETQLLNLDFDYTSSPVNRPLMNKMMADATYRSQYISIYCALMNDFSNAAMDPVIDSLYNLIKTDVYADPNKFYSNQDFDNNINQAVVTQSPMGSFTIAGLKPFITGRRSSLITQLNAEGCTVSIPEIQPATNTLTIYPNPAQNQCTLQFPEHWRNGIVTIQIYATTGRLLNQYSVSNTNTTPLETGTLPPGIYFIRSTSGNEQATGQLIVY